MNDQDFVSAITGNTGDSGWRNMVPQVDSSDFPTQWVPSAYECSIIGAQAKEIEKLRGQNKQLREAAAEFGRTGVSHCIREAARKYHAGQCRGTGGIV